MDYRKEFRVEPDAKVKLKKLDPAYTGKHELQDEAKKETEAYLRKLFEQQILLYAEHKHSILVVLQALDAGGKDGTIKHVFTALNPQGTFVTSFKQPTPAELAHDFLWRVHPHAPAKGEIAIFNRSHYEDVLVPWVHKLISKDTWTKRCQQIRDFEALLSENGTAILKFFLHTSKEEQLARFAQRLDDPKRNWKISESDYTERLLWDDYIEAFEDGISGNEHQGGAVVRYSGGPQVVPQSGGVADHGRHDGGPEAFLPPAFGRPRRDSAQVSRCAQEREDLKKERVNVETALFPESRLE